MKKVILGFAASALVLGLHVRGNTNSMTPPAGYTGAPGQSNCTSCHAGTVNSGSGSVNLISAPAAYVPGATYTLQLVVNDISQMRFGFELAALTSSNQQAGSFTLINANNTAIQTANRISYVSHRNAGVGNSWTFQWTAPATNVGPVTFYMAGNAANGNSSDRGDLIYTNRVILNPQAISGIVETEKSVSRIYPNPVSSTLNVELPKSHSVKVLDHTGKEVSNLAGITEKEPLDVRNFPNGTYFLQVTGKETRELKRFVVQH
ncbi:choice-of-anchor V domain-containing protein [Adhaeribacter soli]|uniref:T9SS type A sorting domain-containing protein n=1 Tax=Adhaeribacter soli TaxID=2607655 RepID=A0A5N1J1C1_9BACT|nr:choice-of-anchor V domain-containing protein [Adhaeribacter soli]KAA9340583.1 T9SS type A sorting domain-containing protein [Adhaeribacter soli]